VVQAPHQIVDVVLVGPREHSLGSLVLGLDFAQEPSPRIALILFI
jgi:hypothetical protein